MHRARASSPRRFANNFPAIAQQLADEQTRLVALIARQRAIAIRDRTVALLTIADDGAGTLSRREGPPRAARLRRPDRQDAQHARPRRVGLGALQARSRHRSCADRRGAGHEPGAMGHHRSGWSPNSPPAPARAARIQRSIFAVGDDKQSIFSFQGAAPDTFDEMRRHFEAHPCAAELPFAPVEFRALVSLGAGRARRGRYGVQTGGGICRARQPIRCRRCMRRCARTAPGVVELWPLVEPEGNAEPDPWDAPFDTTTQTSPRVVLARRIATAVNSWIARGELVGDGDERHPVRAGRYSHSGAPARPAVRSHHPRAEERRHPGRRRRPAGADRAYRRDGPAGARRRGAAAAGRSGAGDGVEIAAVRAVGR